MMASLAGSLKLRIYSDERVYSYLFHIHQPRIDKLSTVKMMNATANTIVTWVPSFYNAKLKFISHCASISHARILVRVTGSLLYCYKGFQLVNQQVYLQVILQLPFQSTTFSRDIYKPYAHLVWL